MRPHGRHGARSERRQRRRGSVRSHRPWAASLPLLPKRQPVRGRSLLVVLFTVSLNGFEKGWLQASGSGASGWWWWHYVFTSARVTCTCIPPGEGMIGTVRRTWSAAPPPPEQQSPLPLKCCLTDRIGRTGTGYSTARIMPRPPATSHTVTSSYTPSPPSAMV